MTDTARELAEWLDELAASPCKATHRDRLIAYHLARMFSHRAAVSDCLRAPEAPPA